MKNLSFKMSALLALTLFSFSGCSIKDADSCEMKYTKIIFHLNLDRDLPEDAVLIQKIKNINPEYNISNRQTNIIKTSYVEASQFYDAYKTIVNDELHSMKNQDSEFKRSIKHSANISKNDCETKTLYIDGIDKQLISNAEFVLSLED